jgi:hypothetical protein
MLMKDNGSEPSKRCKNIAHLLSLGGIQASRFQGKWSFEFWLLDGELLPA